MSSSARSVLNGTTIAASFPVFAAAFRLALADRTVRVPVTIPPWYPRRLVSQELQTSYGEVTQKLDAASSAEACNIEKVID